MALFDRITKDNFVQYEGPKFPVYDYWYNLIVDSWNDVADGTLAITLARIDESVEGEGTAIVYVATEEAATQTLDADESGKTFWIDGSTGASTFTLPAPAAGLNFRWIWTADNNNAIVIQTADITDTSGDMLRGGLLICSAAAVNTFQEASGDENTITVDDNAADKAGGIGSWIEVICTEDPIWFVRGILNSTSDADSTGTQITDAD
jgi:hypothetical protein